MDTPYIPKPSAPLSTDFHMNFNNNPNLVNQIPNEIPYIINEFEKIRFSEFKVSTEQSQEKFKYWIDNLWLKPKGFKKQLDSQQLKKIYIPFYCFQTRYNVNFQGQVAYCQDQHLNIPHQHIKGSNHIDSHNNNQNINQNNLSQCDLDNNVNNNNNALILYNNANNNNNNDKIWSNCNGMITKSINKLLSNACNSNDISLGENIGFLNEVRFHFDFNDTIEKSFQEFKEIMELESIEIKSRYSYQDIWEKNIKNELYTFEHPLVVTYLRQQELTSHVRNITFDIKILDVSVGAYYLPYYHLKYDFEGKIYTFFVDAINGEISSHRPSYGLGKLGDFAKFTKNYFEYLIGIEEKDSKKKGEELANLDGVSQQLYTRDNYFLCFKRSATLLSGASDSGWITLKNTSNSEIIIRAQKRRGSKKGNPLTIKPNEQVNYSYKGHWCIEILKGIPAQLEHVASHPTGGDRFPSLAFE